MSQVTSAPARTPIDCLCAHIHRDYRVSSNPTALGSRVFTNLQNAGSKEKFISSTPSGRNCSGGPAATPDDLPIGVTAWFWPFPVSGAGGTP